MKCFLTALLLLLPARGQAYTAIGQGLNSCGWWTAARQGGYSTGAEQWVLAFAAGTAYASDKDPLSGLDADAVWAWLDNRCRDYPLSAIIDAIRAFIDAHPH
jgi:hypothetical protein